MLFWESFWSERPMCPLKHNLVSENVRVDTWVRRFGGVVHYMIYCCS